MDSFGDYEIRLDPWDVDYGSEVPIVAASPGEPPLETVDLSVEVPGEWSPIRPAQAREPDEIVFVDGVRRADARVLIRKSNADSTLSTHGVFGTFAVGAARTTPGAASWGSTCVGRVLVTGGGVALGQDVEVSRGVAYRPLQVADGDPEAPLRAVQAEMRSAEERVALEAASNSRLVVVDGPLPPSLCGVAPGAVFAGPEHGRSLGLVKRIHELYVGERARVLPRLGVGERTPLFALRSSSRFTRFAWFVRLASPHPSESAMTGLVRLEVSDRVGLGAARALADQSASVLPRFVPSKSRDPRAPQNLLPIGALESHLRRLLGDRRILRRHIQGFLSRGARRG
jgi:hypothetical protein